MFTPLKITIMKKKSLSKVWTGLLACMFVISALVSNGCKDGINDNNDYLIEWAPTLFEANNEIGTLFYDEKTDSWVIVSDSTIKIPNDSLSERVIVYSKSVSSDIENETLNGYIGKKVVFSGIYENDIPVLSNQSYLYLVGHGYYARKIHELKEISLYGSRSLANENKIIECGTKSTPPPAWFFSRNMAEGIDYATAYQMNVFVHVVRPGDGIAGSDYTTASVSSTILSNLNEYFANTNISFILSGSDYIDSDEFINMTVDDFDNDETFSEFLSINRVSNAINVYVLSEAPNLRYNRTARAESIVGTAYLVVEDYYKKSTISHEMGHCLGLYHTHHGTSGRERPSYSCSELVDGSNSSTCGDYVIDTPADPNLWGSNCDYNGTETDANGDVYEPDASNVMAYSGLTCRSHFSQKQVERMHDAINLTHNLESAATIIDKGITGPTQIGTASTYTYTIDVPNASTVLWTIDCTSYATANSSSAVSYTTSGTGSTITLENRYPDALSQKYVINATIYAGTGDKRYEFYTTKTIYKISSPSTTGTLTWSSESPCGDYLGTIDMTNPSNSTIKICKGGILTFNYTDVCGAYSYTDTDVFNFEIYNMNVTKEVGANHVFLIPLSATAPTNGRIMLSLIINGMGNMMQIPVELLPCSQMEPTSVEDSIGVETMDVDEGILFEKE